MVACRIWGGLVCITENANKFDTDKFETNESNLFNKHCKIN